LYAHTHAYTRPPCLRVRAHGQGPPPAPLGTAGVQHALGSPVTPVRAACSRYSALGGRLQPLLLAWAPAPRAAVATGMPLGFAVAKMMMPDAAASALPPNSPAFASFAATGEPGAAAADGGLRAALFSSLFGGGAGLPREVFGGARVGGGRGTGTAGFGFGGFDMGGGGGRMGGVSPARRRSIARGGAGYRP
jgi:hypothetical protein